VDFNTGGSSERPDERPIFGRGADRRVGGPEPGPVGRPGAEFNLQDPVNSFISTVRALVLNPVGFFRDIPRQGNVVNPLIFVVICALVSGILSGFIGFLISLVSRSQGFGGALAGLIGGIILAPIGALIALFIASGVFHLFVLLLVRPSNAGFEATLRVVSYSSVTRLISWIPIIGWIVGFVWGIVLWIFGIREVHATTTGKAVLVVLIPVVVLMILGLLLIAIGVGAALFFGS
jgi:hypothetical protein